MNFTQDMDKVIYFSLMAGAVHALAPDHWIPSSVLIWQRGWSNLRSTVFSAVMFLMHILMGAMIYFAFDKLLFKINPERMVTFTMILVFAVLMARLFRFSRIREVLRAGPNSLWGVVAVISLLGPCESIIPVFLKSRQLGVGYLPALLAFTLGTMSSGITMVLLGRSIWNRPLWLPRGIRIASRSSMALPVIAILALGLRAFMNTGH